MASSSLNPFISSAAQQLFSLVATTSNGCEFRAGGRDISLPYAVIIQRKLSAPTSLSNDHVYLRARRTERNVTTGKLATAQVQLDISIPKDTSILTQTVLKQMISALASLLNEATAMEATTANMTALVEGRDL